ncbi:hypothetical protein [Frigidibacter sp. SD6-1]|uniref:MoaF-related domain-containing protein n=1 Tax=Frigidibacter sp. SD6-1 TaxID=3032581 RepID=UPI0024DFB0C1|nr:hypothetical protein [Frigidibacter sp. SD6-1]
MTLRSSLAAAATLMALALPALAEEAPYPAVGHVYKADFGDPVFRVAFDADGTTFRWAPFAAEDFDAVAKTETYQATYIRPGVYMVTWREADGLTVTHVEDFENDTLYSSITLPDRTFLNLTGTWTRLD